VKLQKTVLLAAVFALFGGTAHACEPILPFITVVGGPGILIGSWVALLAAVILKSVIFSFLQKKLSFPRAFMLMVAGNILTTVVGFLVAALIGSGPIMFFGALIVWPLCILPAKRAIAAVNHPWLKRFTAGSLAAVMALALVASCFLFGISSLFADSNHLGVYWIWKLTAVYTALIVSIVLTAFWEEWVVWKLSRCPVEYTGYVQPVIRANLVILLCVMLFAAGVALPQRLKSHNFLVKLGLIPSISLEVKNQSSLHNNEN
jgi:hypothetical protein